MNRLNLIQSLFFIDYQQQVNKSTKCKGGKTPPTNEAVRKSFFRLKKTQKRFQVKDGNPVWLKAGSRDKLLYQLSWVLVFGMIGASLHVLYSLTFKKTRIVFGKE